MHVLRMKTASDHTQISEYVSVVGTHLQINVYVYSVESTKNQALTVS